MVRYIALLPGYDQRGLFLQKVNKQADGASSFPPAHALYLIHLRCILIFRPL